MDNQAINEEALKGIVELMVKNLPKYKSPPLLNSIIDFKRAHLLVVSIFSVVFIILISMLAREAICWYYKTNKILEKLDNIEKKLK